MSSRKFWSLHRPPASSQENAQYFLGADAGRAVQICQAGGKRLPCGVLGSALPGSASSDLRRVAPLVQGPPARVHKRFLLSQT